MGSKGLTLLAIDKDVGVLDSLRTMISKRLPDVRLSTAESTSKAAALARAHEPDVILIDLALSQAHDHAFCKGFMNGKRRRPTSILFMMDPIMDRDAAETAFAVGADGFLHKPLDEVELLAQVKTVSRILSAERRAGGAPLASDAARRDEPDFALLFEKAPHVAALIGLSDAKIMAVNERFETVLGYSREEAVGRSSLELGLYPEPGARDRAISYVQERGIGRDIETRLRTKSGEIRDFLVNTDFLEFDGRKHVLVTAQDITEQRQAEEVLGRNKMRYETLIETIPQKVFIKDRDSVYVSANESFARDVGLDADRLVGKTDYDLFPASLAGKYRADDKRVIETGSTEDLEEEYLVAGRKLWVQTVKTPIRDESGEVAGVLGIFWDITARKQAEEALRSSQRELTLRNRIAEVFLTHSDDEMYNEVLAVILEATASELGVFGYLDDEGALVAPSMTRQAWHKCQVPDKRIVFPRESWGNSSWPTSLREKRTILLNVSSSSIPEGHIPIARQLTVPLMHRGDAVGLIQVANKPTDYTQEDVALLETLGNAIAPVLAARLSQERQEAARRMAEADGLRAALEWKRTFDATNDAVWIIDAEHKVLRANRASAQIFGRQLEDLLGRHCWEIVHGTDGPVSECPLARAKISLRRETMDLAIGERWYEVTVDPIVGPDGKYSGAVHVVKDSTDRKQAEMERERLREQLTQAQRLESVGRLAGGVAHDFNNMLGVILGHTEMVLAEVSPTQPIYSELNEIRRAAEHSADIIRQLLAFARRQTVVPRPLDLNETVEKMLSMLRRLIGEDIDLVWVPGKGLWEIEMDPSQLDQILANLCTNARDAIRDVGRLTIETANVTKDEDYCAAHVDFVPGEYVALTVSGNGAGMDKETMAQIFDPFFTTKELGRGTGLGLATVYGIVKQNAGFISVYSEPQMGTTFRIYFPRSQRVASRVTPEADAREDAHGTETILLAEDEPAILRTTARMMEHLGYTVLTAASPGEALYLAETYPGTIDMLVTDVVMPDMNGRELATRALALRPELGCLFTSGYTANVIAHHGVLDPDVHFIQKPFTIRGLAAKMREVLDHGTSAKPGDGNSPKVD